MQILPSERELKQLNDTIIVVNPETPSKLIPTEHTRHKGFQGRKKKGWYPVEKRVQVATAYAAGMTNSVDLEQLTGISQVTIRSWMIADWWHEMLSKVRFIEDTKADAKMTRIVDKTLDTIMDRVTDGDFHINKFGVINRKPMSGRDAAMITSVMVDKRNLMRGKPLEEKRMLKENEQLTKLADQFRKFITAKTIQGEVIHDEKLDQGRETNAVNSETQVRNDVEDVIPESIQSYKSREAPKYESGV